MNDYCLQMLQWKQANGFVLTREEESLLLELTSQANDLLNEWVDNFYY